MRIILTSRARRGQMRAYRDRNPRRAEPRVIEAAARASGEHIWYVEASLSGKFMKRIPASVHRSLDTLAVICFLAAPVLLRLTGRAAMLSYALAVIHILVTVATKFPDTGHKPLSLRSHGWIELVVGIVLIVLPWVVGWTGTARTYYVTAGILLLIVWGASNYGRQYGAERAQKARG